MEKSKINKTLPMEVSYYYCTECRHVMRAHHKPAYCMYCGKQTIATHYGVSANWYLSRMFGSMFTLVICLTIAVAITDNFIFAIPLGLAALIYNIRAMGKATKAEKAFEKDHPEE